MVYSWGLFWPREPGVLNQRRISRSFQGASRENRQAGRQASEIADSDKITTSLREDVEMISVTCSPPAIWPTSFHFLARFSYVDVPGEMWRVCSGAELLWMRCCHSRCLHACVRGAHHCNDDATHLSRMEIGWEAVSRASLKIHYPLGVCVCVLDGEKGS